MGIYKRWRTTPYALGPAWAARPPGNSKLNCVKFSKYRKILQCENFIKFQQKRAKLLQIDFCGTGGDTPRCLGKQTYIHEKKNQKINEKQNIFAKIAISKNSRVHDLIVYHTNFFFLIFQLISSISRKNARDHLLFSSDS